MIVVDPDVTKLKLDREVEAWQASAPLYRRRGWLLLDRQGAQIDVGFLAQLSLGGQSVPVMAACVRLDYTNYDVWPPSVEFIDPRTGDYVAPVVQAIMQTDEGPRNILVSGHPETDRPFLCVPGTRQYHSHPQHSGDLWLLHRGAREGSLVTVCDRIWRTMARTMVGLQVALLTLPAGSAAQVHLQIQLATGDVDALKAGSPSLQLPGGDGA
jgi:hypothetical protein